MSNNNQNFEITYSTDCCGYPCHSDQDICPECLEHCEVIEDRIDYESSEAVHAAQGLDYFCS
jgi:hypothetical protein